MVWSSHNIAKILLLYKIPVWEFLVLTLLPVKGNPALNYRGSGAFYVHSFLNYHLRVLGGKNKSKTSFKNHLWLQSSLAIEHINSLELTVSYNIKLSLMTHKVVRMQYYGWWCYIRSMLDCWIVGSWSIHTT